MMKLFRSHTFKVISHPTFNFSVLGNQHLSKDSEVIIHSSRIRSLRSIQLSIIPLMLSLLALEEQACELLLDLFSRDLRLLAFPNYFQLGHIQLRPREVLMLLLEICITMIGDGMPTIL